MAWVIKATPVCVSQTLVEFVEKRVNTVKIWDSTLGLTGFVSFFGGPICEGERICGVGWGWGRLSKEKENTVKICDSALCLSDFVCFFRGRICRRAYLWRIYRAICGPIWFSKLSGGGLSAGWALSWIFTVFYFSYGRSLIIIGRG